MMASAAVATATSSSPAQLATNGTNASTSNASNDSCSGNVTSQKTESNQSEQHANQPQHHRQLQNQQQQLEQDESKPPSTEGEDIGTETSNSQPFESPLSPDLRKIILEVARTGTCSWLSWDQHQQHAVSEIPSEHISTATNPHQLAPVNAFASRQAFVAHRRSGSSPYTGGAIGQAPPRKKQRNGMHKSSRRRLDTKVGRKRPLFLIRTNNPLNNQNVPAPGSVGSGRTSGSEPDDSTQYECDSEGTSATTNSEVSVERLRKTQQIAHDTGVQGSHQLGSPAARRDEGVPSPHTKTLREAFRVALGLVLDHFYRKCGGYKLSPAERRKNQTSVAVVNGPEPEKSEARATIQSSEYIFQQRRQKLLAMVLPHSEYPDRALRLQNSTSEPPFTIQRIAEVLASPERYYTQTHKLCNCLEKLLLVKSSTGAFGGSRGGDTSQSRREERELAALADEKGRQESELRLRRLRRRTSSPSDDAMNSNEEVSRTVGSKDETSTQGQTKPASPKKKAEALRNNGHTSQTSTLNNESDSRELLEAAARASLRTKFDHVGIDPHSSPDRDLRSIAENRGMTNSPPPPSLAMSAAPSNIALQGHSGVSGFVRQHLPEQNSEHHSIACVPSPILFPPGGDPTIHPSTNMHMLQLHHAVTLAGALGRPTSSPLDLMTIDAGSNTAGRGHSNLGGGSEGGDLEMEHGRSSASNSDVDSESDDISLDDSASDRSDGSDSGSVTHYEPFTAARAMALNRMQQQQRLQSRVLTSLGSVHATEGFRPPADSEYQSGDSIDSMRAEDSGGSDSSSSDLAD